MSALPSVCAWPKAPWRDAEKPLAVARLPTLQDALPVRRYERQSPGALLHLDTKKLARFDRPGHRVTGDRAQNKPRAGWQALHVAMDD